MLNSKKIRRGEDYIANSFRMFKPILVHYIFLWKTKPGVSFKETILNFQSVDIYNKYLRDLEILDDREYIIIQLQMDLKPTMDSSSNDGWADITTKDIKRVMSLTRKLTDKWISSPKTKNSGLKLIGTSQIIITGADEDYWVKPRIDIHKFKIDMNGLDRSMRLGDIEAENKLMVFSKALFGGKHVLGDRLENIKLPTTIYGLGKSDSDDFDRLPQLFLLSLTVNSNLNNKEAGEVQNKKFRLSVNSVIASFGRLFIYMAKLLDLNKDEYPVISKQSHQIRDNSLKLQMKINDLLVTKSDKSLPSSTQQRQLKVESDEKLGYIGMEENLLLKASRYFSILTEINQVEARANYHRQDATTKMEKLSQTLGLTPIPLSTETNNEIPSLNGELKQLSNSIDFNFQNLKIELEHSQTTIRNTVDILKTFLESEQRMVSQKSSEAINWIVIVFAGLGLADALGNFVIFWLEGGSWFSAMFWFFVIIVTLILVIVTLYFWYFKRPKYLKAFAA